MPSDSPSQPSQPREPLSPNALLDSLEEGARADFGELLNKLVTRLHRATNIPISNVSPYRYFALASGGYP